MVEQRPLKKIKNKTIIATRWILKVALNCSWAMIFNLYDRHIYCDLN